jgi:hypothetical protein
MRIIDGFILRNVMGQATIVGEGVGQIDFNKLITLNDSAAYLWQSVEGKEFDMQTLANLLVDKYGIDQDTALTDAKAIANKWIEIGVVNL